MKWTKHLIELSRRRREACPELTSLFLTTRGRVKSASRATIAGWINTIFSKIGLHVSPGSIRSAVGSFNFQNEIALDTILKRGNWRGAKKFFKHYCKDVKRFTESANNPLYQLFEPV